MRVLITGATGFIGRHLVARLAGTGHDLWCLVRDMHRAEDLENSGVTLVKGDVTDRDSLNQAMRDRDCLINLANIYSMWEPNKEIYTAVNVEGTRNVLECALETGISKVVHVSTAGIYGKPADLPFTEESGVGPVRFSEYSRTKYAGSIIAWELYEKRGLPLVTVIPGAVLGPGDTKPTGQYIKNLINRRMPITVFKDSVMTYVHVRDVVEAIVRAAEKKENTGGRYLVGKHQVSFREINDMVAEISGVPPPRLHLPDAAVAVVAAILTALADLTKRPPPWGMCTDQARMAKAGFRFDGSKAERELGIVYTPIRTTLEEAIAWYRSSGRET